MGKLTNGCSNRYIYEFSAFDSGATQSPVQNRWKSSTGQNNVLCTENISLPQKGFSYKLLLLLHNSDMSIKNLPKDLFTQKKIPIKQPTTK